MNRNVTSLGQLLGLFKMADSTQPMSPILAQKAIAPEPHDGYAFAQLHTTTNGLHLINQALKEYIPEPCEATLHASMLEALRREGF